jgi:hypothetical protein
LQVPVSVVVTLSAPTGAQEVVQLSTAPLSATATQDYKPITKSVTFSVGQNLKEFRIPILPDPSVEGNEQFKVMVSVVSGPVPVAKSEGIVTILDCVEPT